MLTKNQLLIKIADALGSGAFLDELPSWVGEVQLKEDGIRVRIDDDHSDPCWFSIMIAPA